jgi:cation/acetate symporter
VPAALAADRAAAQKKLDDLKAANAPWPRSGCREGAGCLPKDEAAAKDAWTKRPGRANARARPLAGMPRHAAQFAGNPDGDAAAQKAYNESRRNFLALVFCLMVGTAALPHILMRYYTTPVGEGGAAVGDLVAVLHLPAVLHRAGPGGAGQVRGVHRAGGHPFDQLPAWVGAWARVDPACCRWSTSTRTASCSSAR